LNIGLGAQLETFLYRMGPARIIIVLKSALLTSVSVFTIFVIQKRDKQNKHYEKLSCRREAARCFVFVCSQLQHTAQFLVVVTVASDLLVHKILLHFVLLSPIVSGGVRPKLPGQTPLHHNPPSFLPLEGRFGPGPAS